MSWPPRQGYEVASFESLADMRDAYAAKRAFIKDPARARDLYYRDGTIALAELEVRLAQLAGVDPEILMAYNTGMTVITDSLEVALHVANTDKPVLACASKTYNQTTNYVETFIKDRRAHVHYFDSGDPDSVAEVMEKLQPDVIVFETIGNSEDASVVDIEHFLGHTRAARKRPILVVDHTLPLESGLDLSSMLTAEDRALIGVSGTKAHILNGDLLGIGYTRDEELFDFSRRLRRARGTLLSPSHTEMIDRLLPDTPEEFHERNRRIFKNAGDVAMQLAAIAPEDSHISVNHPAIASHRNHDVYTRLYPDGGAPAVFIVSSEIDQYAITDRLWDNAAVHAEATRLGQSFGFDYTRIMADQDLTGVRLAIGAETNPEAFAEACAEALYID